MVADKNKRDEQNLERYGVWVKAGPDEFTDPTETNFELMEIEDVETDSMLITEEEEKLLGELEESAHPNLDDIDDAFVTTEPEEPKSNAASDAESKQLMHKIEVELSALHDEIRQLKEELTDLKAPAVGASQDQNAEAGGFFDEEDDETIALTGDELDNILDSAEMTEESMKEPEEAMPTAYSDDGADIDEEDIIDISIDNADSEVHEFDIEEAVVEDDPAFSMLASPEEPEDQEDPDTIEIDILGLDDALDFDEGKPEETTEEPVVSIDDITEGIEEIADIEVDNDTAKEIPSIDDLTEEALHTPPIEDMVVTEVMDDGESSDEGEEVEIDLTGIDDEALGPDALESNDVEIESISFDDLELNHADEILENEPVESGESDVLAISGGIDLNAEAETPMAIDEGLAKVTASEIVLDDGDEVTIEALETEEFPLEREAGEDIDAVVEEIETSMSEDDFDIEDIEIKDIGLSDLPDVAIEKIDDSPEISLDDAIDKIDSVDEFSLDDVTESDGPDIQNLKTEETEDEVSVTLPDDDFNELPGTEKIDLYSLDALATAPDLTQEPVAESVTLPEMESDDEESLDLLTEDESAKSAEIEVELPDIQFNDTEPEEMSAIESVDIEESKETADIEVILTAEQEKISGEEIDITMADVDAIEDDLAQVTVGESVADALGEDFASNEFDLAKLPNQNNADDSLEIRALPTDLREEIKDVLQYMDQLLESLPDDKIQEFARSEHFEVYKKIFEELGISE